jgi:hypothetical protein
MGTSKKMKGFKDKGGHTLFPLISSGIVKMGVVCYDYGKGRVVSRLR